MTTHIDQGAFQATNTPADGAAHEDNFTMHFPFLELHEEGKGTARLRINFLHMETDDGLPELSAAPEECLPVLRQRPGEDRRHRRVHRRGHRSRAVPSGAQGRQGDRAEVHSLGRRANAASAPPDFELEITAFETVNTEFGDRGQALGGRHVPGITQEVDQPFQGDRRRAVAHRMAVPRGQLPDPLRRTPARLSA